MANDVFSPPELKRRHIALSKNSKWQKLRKGAAILDGKMIDAASEKMALNIIDVANAISAKSAAE